MATTVEPSIEPGIRIGPWELVPGVRRKHFYSLLGTSFFTIGLLTLIGNLQPYLFNAVLAIPRSVQGSLGGNLAAFNEVLFLIVASFVGAASDKIGRRRIYALGFGVMIIGLVLYPLATKSQHLYYSRAVFAIGAACVSAMLAAVIADYSVERTRGRLVGICFFLNGMGVATLVLLAGKLPRIIEGMGVAPEITARCAYWTVAALCLIPMTIVAFGLQPGAPARLSPKEPLFTTLKIGLAAARDPKVLLAYLSAMVSRGDLAVLSTFFALWLTNYGISKGVSAGAAQAAATQFFALSQVVATFWALIVIFFIDRFDRVLATALAMTMAAASYITIGTIDDPLGPGMYAAAAFMGVGEMSGVLASQSLVGQVATERGRGAIIGVFSMFGAAGILLATKIGGYVFDAWRPSAPYFVVGVADGVVAAIAFGIYFYTRSRRSDEAISHG